MLDRLVILDGIQKPGGRVLLRKATDAWARIAILRRLAAAEEPLPDLRPAWWRAEDLERPEVLAWRRTLLADGGRGLRRWVERAGPYYLDILSVIERNGLPPELWVLTLVESGLRPQAVSRAAAVGPWQFMATTARYCGLLITTDRDERRDWVSATQAACRYLAELKAQFGDGLLALAAFNCGPSRVRAEIAENEDRGFWDLVVPRETREYVPRTLALIDLLGDGTRIPYSVDTTRTLTYDLLDLPYTVEVSHLARACGATAKELHALNPAWLLPITPADGKPVRARLPAGSSGPVADQFTRVSIPEIKVSPGRMYQVRRGDTLWGISRRFRLNLKTLLKVNGLSGKEIIHPGRAIRLPG
jgi:membrane-bound lytic murein transglycosylase D